MEKKIAIVSGANGNLGSAVVDYLLQENWQVNGLVHSKKEKNSNPNYQELELNLMDDSLSESYVQEIIKERKRIDSLVLTVGGFKMGDIAKTSSADIVEQFNLNFLTAYHLVKPVLSQMKTQQQGTLFFVGSFRGQDTTKGGKFVAYSLAKSLLFSLADMINAEAKEEAIKAYVVVPNTIDTPQNRKAMPNADFSQWEKPADIAKIIGKYTSDYDKTTKNILIVEEGLKLL